MQTPLHLLVVADAPERALEIAGALEGSGFELTYQRVDTPVAVRQALAEQLCDVIIADQAMPGFGGSVAAALLQMAQRSVPIVLLSDSRGEPGATAEAKDGVQVYILENGLSSLGPAVQRVLKGTMRALAPHPGARPLQDSEARLRGMVDDLQVGFTMIDHGRLVYANEHFSHILGYPKDEYIGMTLADIAAPEEQERLQKVVQEAERTGRLPDELEFAVIRKDGARRYVRCRCLADKDSSLAAGRYVVTMNVTDHKEIGQEDEARRRYLEQVLDAAPDAIVTLDPERRVVEWNPGAERLFGYSKDEVIGREVDHLISSPDTHAEAAAFTQSLLKGQEVPPVAAIRYRKDGTPVDVIAAGSPILVGHQLLGAVAIYTDICRQTRAERLLRALNQAALSMEEASTPEQLFEAAAKEFGKLGWLCVIYLTDASKTRLKPAFFSHDSHAIRTARKLLGLTSEEFCLSIANVEAFQKVVWDRATVLIEGVEVTQQLLPKHFRRLAGQLVKILQIPRAIGAPLVVDDEVRGILSVQSADLSHDDIPVITAFSHLMAAAWGRAGLVVDLRTSLEELRRTQLQLLQAQKMEAVGRLAGGVAHDFNNLLTAIGLSTEILRRQLHPDDPAWVYVRQIQEVGERAARLTEQLLSFSRREAAEMRNLNLSQLVVDVSHMLQRLIGEDIQLNTSLADNLWPVRANPSNMEQVIVNLVVNARDAMPHGGRLTIETANIVLDQGYADQHVEVQPGRYVLLAISDTGVGMDERVKAHLFEPFFTTKGEGSGLGLSTVYGIVKQSEGYIWVYSEPGLGATFKIYLPYTETDEALPEPACEAIAQDACRGTETVLVVEDDANVRAASAQILLAHGYRALAARNGIEALELSRQHTGPIHLLVSDVVMPEMSGPDLAARLHKKRPHMKVMYVSGHTEQAITNYGLLTKGAPLLSKPFSAAALAQKVRLVLDNQDDT